MTDKQAEAMILRLEAYMLAMDAQHPDVDGLNYPIHHDTAARWARTLLEASGRPDYYGCPLCRS